MFFIAADLGPGVFPPPSCNKSGKWFSLAFLIDNALPDDCFGFRNLSLTRKNHQNRENSVSVPLIFILPLLKIYGLPLGFCFMALSDNISDQESLDAGG
jgi:hypothetical protein